MAKKPTSPIKVTAHLADGRLNSADGVVLLDGILYHAWFYKYAPHVLEGNGRNGFRGYIGLPLRLLDGTGWAGSRAIYKESGQTVEVINKRPDFFAADKLNHLQEEKGLISSKMGPYRAYRMPAIIRTVRDATLTFWGMGHRDEVQELLNFMPAVGKKVAVGYGLVDHWTVEDCEEDYSVWHNEYGLMRPVEVGSDLAASLPEIGRYPVMRYAIHPPYWKTENLRLCYVPISTR